MSQQINLLNPALIKQKDLLNTNTMVIALGLLLAVMLGVYGYTQKQMVLLKAQRSQVAEQLTTVQTQLTQVSMLHAPHEIDKTLLDKMTQLEQKEAMQQQVMQTVNQSSATPEKGYAALMRALAKQSIDGLWLTSFSIDSHSERLNISGRTLQADLVPDYISRLGHEAALKGKTFSALSMHLPKAEINVTNQSSPVNTQLNNVFASAPKNVANTVATSPLNQAVEASYLEFSLQSIDDKSAVSVAESTLGGKS